MPSITFPSGMADAIANIIFQEQCIDLAITLGRQLGPHGIAHYLMTPAEHQQRFGVPPNRLAMPEPYDDPNPLPMANRKREFTMFDIQEAAFAQLEKEIESAYPVHIREMMLVDHSLRHITLQEQFAFLKLHLRLTKADIFKIRLDVSKPYLAGAKIQTHVAAQLSSLRALATAQQPVPPLEATGLMIAAFTSTPTDALDFAACIAGFYKDHGALDDQTPANFGPYAIKYVSEQLVHHQSVNAAARAAAKPAYARTATEDTELSTEERAELIALRAAAVQPPPAHPRAGAPKKKASKKGNLPVRLTARALLAGAPAWYCHSCGVEFQLGYEHYSCECRDRKPGHQKHATFTNQMGGKRA